MYICLDCDFIFDKPKHYTETHGLDTPPYEEWSGCPLCSGAYVAAKECVGCGEYFSGEYVELLDGTVFCDMCYQIKNTDNEV